MSTTQLLSLPFVTTLIKRIDDYTVRHLSGADNIPQLCVKAKHSNGFAWFGINILPGTEPVAENAQRWTPEQVEAFRSRFREAMHKITDLVEIQTDLDRLIESIQDVVFQRRQPIIYGGRNNQFIQSYLNNNMQLDVFREEIPQDTQSYGGYLCEVSINDTKYPGFLYHRGIVLYNYIDMAEAQDIVFKSIARMLPEGMTVDSVDICQEVSRTRNRQFKGRNNE